MALEPGGENLKQMQTYLPFLVPAGFALFVAVVGIVSVILERRNIARSRRATEEEGSVAYR